MEFDHCKGEKLFNLSDAARLGKSRVDIDEEIEKCFVVCAICHRLKTYAVHHRLDPVKLFDDNGVTYFGYRDNLGMLNKIKRVWDFFATL